MLPDFGSLQRTNWGYISSFMAFRGICQRKVGINSSTIAEVCLMWVKDENKKCLAELGWRGW